MYRRFACTNNAIYVGLYKQYNKNHKKYINQISSTCSKQHCTHQHKYVSRKSVGW
jgi:hypothetical protein